MGVKSTPRPSHFSALLCFASQEGPSLCGPRIFFHTHCGNSRASSRSILPCFSAKSPDSWGYPFFGNGPTRSTNSIQPLEPIASVWSTMSLYVQSATSEPSFSTQGPRARRAHLTTSRSNRMLQLGQCWVCCHEHVTVCRNAITSDSAIRVDVYTLPAQQLRAPRRQLGASKIG